MHKSSSFSLNHSTDQLFKQRHQIFFFHSDVVLKSAALTVFVDQEYILFLYDELVQLDDVGMLKVSEYFHLALEEMFEFIISDELIPSDHLDGHLLGHTITISFIDFAKLSLAHHFA